MSCADLFSAVNLSHKSPRLLLTSITTILSERNHLIMNLSCKENVSIYEVWKYNVLRNHEVTSIILSSNCTCTICNVCEYA